MILRSIELENFGLYAGRQRLDLLPSRDRPVVLIGGRNGAGKTTLLEAVRLALYGRRALGARVGQSEYDEHLANRTHVDADGRVSVVASVGLEFDYAEAGVVQHYRVSRRWTVRGAKVVETLMLEKDGSPVDEVPREEWHGFLQELIPPGVSQLFFFDGEKIAEIARDDPDEGLAEAVQGLLGIELVSRLRTDIGLFLARRNRKDDGGGAERLQAVVRDRAALQKRIGDLAEHVAELRSRTTSLERAASNVRLRFTAEGGDAADRRAATEAERNEVRSQITQREAELRELAGGLLPFAAAPRLLRRFATALAQTGGIGRREEAESLRTRLLGWRAAGEPGRKASWKDAHWSDLEAFLAAESDAVIGSDGPLAGLDVAERRRLASKVADARDAVPARVGVLVRDLDALQRRVRPLEAELVRAAGKGTTVVLDELLLSEKEVGAAEAELKARSEELKQLEYQKVTLNREEKRLVNAQNEQDAGEERAVIATRVGRVLQQYEERLLQHKLAQLRIEFVERFNHLARKGGFVADVRIDPATFDATLIDRSGTEIRKSSLSAGEKQIYAIAMLWALARTSGRALPMIIDTPLARLDSEHRATIVERYFAEASHQVIVLSTDTEVDDDLLARLGPSVSHSYRLDYDPDTRSTTAAPGYFGQEGVHALQQA